jgi:hypothetical protein
MSKEKRQEFLVEGHSGVVQSSLLSMPEIRSAYLKQLMWLSIMIALGLLLWFGYYKGSYSADTFVTARNGLQITLTVAVCAAIAIVVAYLAVANAHLRYAMSIRAEIKPLPQGMRDNLEPLLTPLLETLPPNTKLEIGVQTRALHWAPSVVEDNKSALLILPLGFFGLFRKDREAARAILAHEIGHIRFRDSWIFATQNANAIAFRWVVVPAILAVVFTTFASQSPVGLSTWALIGVFTNARKVKRSLIQARFATEERADLYAVVHADKDALARVLRMLGEVRMHARHPAPAARIATIDNSGVLIENGNTNLEPGAKRKKYQSWRPGGRRIAG